MSTTHLQYPYQLNDGQTHFGNCFCTPHHHNCAVAKVYELESEIAQLKKQLSADRLSMLERVAELGYLCGPGKSYTTELSLEFDALVSQLNGAK